MPIGADRSWRAYEVVGYRPCGIIARRDPGGGFRETRSCHPELHPVDPIGPIPVRRVRHPQGVALHLINPRTGDLERTQHTLGFVEGFLVFPRRFGVGDDPRADLGVDAPLMRQRRWAASPPRRGYTGAGLFEGTNGCSRSE